jgi:hypothetical protein
VPPRKYNKRIMEMMESIVTTNSFEGKVEEKEVDSATPLHRTLSMDK